MKKKQRIAVIGPNPIQSTKFPQNPDPIQPNPIQSNPWMDPIHVQLWSVHQGSISSLTNELICHPEIRHVDGSVQPTSDCIFRSLRPYNLRSSVNSRWLILLTHTRAYNPHRSNVLSCALMVSLLWRSTSVTGNLF